MSVRVWRDEDDSLLIQFDDDTIYQLPAGFLELSEKPNQMVESGPEWKEMVIGDFTAFRDLLDRWSRDIDSMKMLDGSPLPDYARGFKAGIRTCFSTLLAIVQKKEEDR